MQNKQSKHTGCHYLGGLLGLQGPHPWPPQFRFSAGVPSTQAHSNPGARVVEAPTQVQPFNGGAPATNDVLNAMDSRSDPEEDASLN